MYLQSINGLVATANYDPDLIIDLLTKEYVHLDDRKFVDKDRGMEIRTKIGEALVRVTRDLGQMTPAYRDKLLNPFLSQLNHPDPLVQASSLSNLGEVCKNLKFSLGGIVQEVRPLK